MKVHALISNNAVRLGVIGLLALILVRTPSLIHAAPLAAISLSSTYTQNFNSLATSGTTNAWTNDSTLSGWYAAKAVAPNNITTYRADTGTSNAGALYSYGSTGATERALGSVSSGTPGTIYYGARFVNDTGTTINSIDVSYTGEQWRNGGNTTAQKITFDYQIGATGLLTGTWTPVTSLNFTGPIASATAGALDGNANANRTAIGPIAITLSLAPGQEVWIRWSDINDPGNDHGLAVDDLSVTAHAVVLPNLTIDNVSLNEGNTGTTTFSFTVSLSAPAGAGGVTFDISTGDDTATFASDYVTKTLTSQTIPAGSSNYTFDVLVNGDTTPETNETFYVNVSNVTGANVTDSQGTGTIVNDDAAPNLTLNDVSLNEGNSGTTTFTFTVSLSAPAPTGGVTFDISTLDGTATAASDYVSKTLTGQTISAGNSAYTFTVLINGDTTPESDETFSVNVTNATNAILIDGQGLGTIVNDDLFKIHDVQGNSATSPLVGGTVAIEGVVIGSYQGINKLQGFFLQEEDADADADPLTSEGIFIYCNTCPTTVAEGQRVRATGTVSEYNGMTEITASSAGSVVVTDAGNHLAEVTPASISLPIVGDVNAFYEAREGMRVTFVDTLTVSEYFELVRYGQIELYQGGRPTQFTETTTPNAAGYTAHLNDLARRRVILDDDNDAQEAYLNQTDGSQFIFYPRANGGFSVGTQGTDFFRGGDVVNGLTGILHWSWSGYTGTDAWRIRPTNATPATFTVANPRPSTPPSVGGAIKAVSMNLLNYFTTIDTTSSSSSGPCGPSGTQDCRGADSVAELNRQRERASIVICSLNADVYGLMEVENTTPSDTITDLLGAVNARCGGSKPYAFVNTGGTLGTDAIRVMLMYRTGTLAPAGSPLVDLDPIHNRPPTAQTFDVVDATNSAFGERFTVIANHFKSKGCSGATGADVDAGDGQSCFSDRRTQQAARLLTWINGTVLPAAGDPDVLLLGDFNSYAQETPITTLTSGGYTDLASSLLGPSSYSYLFDGELGHLDYALSNTSLTSKITSVGNWHINADEVDLMDYNDEVKDVGEATYEEKPDGSALVPPRVVFQAATPYRAADHDPVIVGLFPSADLSVTKTDSPDPVTIGNNLTYVITVTNAGPDLATSVVMTDGLPAATTFVSLASPAGWNCTTPAVGTNGTVSCSRASLAVANANFTLTVSVNSAGNLSNTATVTSATNDPNPGNESNTATTTVNKASSATTLVSSLNPTTVGQSVTFTATIGAIGPSKPSGKSPRILECLFNGTVQFKDGSTNLGTAQSLDASCHATLTTNALSVGSHPITAVYSGDTNYNGSTSNQVNQVVNNAKLYLPLINKNFVDAPNLVVDNLIVTSNDVQVVIKNTGTKPVVDEFWIDLYINPNIAPSSVNQTWQMLGSQGMVWGVTSSALPINPGETRTFSIANDPNHYFWSSLSNFNLPIQNATVYVQVDSSNAGVAYGAVQENHEIAGMAYDNIRKFTVTSGVVSLPINTLRDPANSSRLPKRP